MRAKWTVAQTLPEQQDERWKTDGTRADFKGEEHDKLMFRR